MGIAVNALSIFLGALFGSILKKHFRVTQNNILGIGIMFISLAGIIENLFTVSHKSLSSDNLFPVVFTLIIGTTLGELMKLDKIIKTSDNNAFLTGSVFFGIGGLQISGPMLLAISNDSSQLILKSAVDFPFALALGATCGMGIAVSAFPVAMMQILIAFTTYMASSFINESMVGQICSLGYIILFFTGFNLIVGEKYKVNTLNMLPSIILLIIYNIIIRFWR